MQAAARAEVASLTRTMAEAQRVADERVRAVRRNADAKVRCLRRQGQPPQRPRRQQSGADASGSQLSRRGSQSRGADSPAEAARTDVQAVRSGRRSAAGGVNGSSR
jgi:hypothetical protein